MALQVGEVFAGYTILRVLGAGGMGQVYLAKHPRLPREDALKVLSAELTADPQYRARFLREADIAATLWHPHILGIHDRGEFNGQFWISMDFVRGHRRGQTVGRALWQWNARRRGDADHRRGGVGVGLRPPAGPAAPRCQAGEHSDRRARAPRRNECSWRTSVSRATSTTPRG